MTVLFLASLLVALLLAVRLMLYGAERRQPADDALPLRRSEPAAVAFLFMFGAAGYLLLRRSSLDTSAVLALAAISGALFAALVTRLAIATARVQPAHDHDDPRFSLQGRVGVAVTPLAPGDTGSIVLDDGTAELVLSARPIHDDAIPAGEEVCIERVEDSVAYVERWALVEQRL